MRTDKSKRMLFTLWMCFENRLNCKDCTHANPLRGHSEFTGYALHFVNNLKESSIMVRSIVSIAQRMGPENFQQMWVDWTQMVLFTLWIRYPLIYGGYSEDWIVEWSIWAPLEGNWIMLWKQTKMRFLEYLQVKWLIIGLDPGMIRKVSSYEGGPDYTGSTHSIVVQTFSLLFFWIS